MIYRRDRVVWGAVLIFVPFGTRKGSRISRLTAPNDRLWHVRDVTPAATRAAAINGAADIPAHSPFMLRPRCRTLKALSCSDPIMIDRNARSSSTGLHDHLPPEWMITIDRNAHTIVET
jgi:hypothetical protein